MTVRPPSPSGSRVPRSPQPRARGLHGSAHQLPLDVRAMRSDPSGATGRGARRSRDPCGRSRGGGTSRSRSVSAAAGSASVTALEPRPAKATPSAGGRRTPPEDPRDRIRELRGGGSLEHVALRPRLERSPDVPGLSTMDSTRIESAREPIDERLDDGGPADPFRRQVRDDHARASGPRRRIPGWVRKQRFLNDGSGSACLQRGCTEGNSAPSSRERLPDDVQHATVLQTR